MATNITADLSLFHFERGVDPSHYHLLPLRERSKGLMITACAHAVFLCKLLHTMRQEEGNKGYLPIRATKHLLGFQIEPLKVGIIGGGHTGRQLVGALKELSDVPLERIRISTRRPETLTDLQELGLDCFYNNCRITSWADILFLCCLPSHLPKICSEIKAELREYCIVYSLVSAVPVSRLRQLLSHPGILRPKYKFQQESDPHPFQLDFPGDVTAALRDMATVQATTPWTRQGGITVNDTWIEAVLYAALNSCKTGNLSHQHSLHLLNVVIHRMLPKTQRMQKPHPQFMCENFINKTFASSLTDDDEFPLFDLTAVQSKETPLSRLLTSSLQMRDLIAQVYCAAFGTPTEVHHLALSSPRQKTTPLSQRIDAHKESAN